MKRFKNILCVVNDQKLSRPSLGRAVTLAENNQASLTVVHVVERISAGIGMPAGGPISNELQAALIHNHQQVLETLVEPYRQRVTIETKVLVGTPFLAIVREVLGCERDLVVKVPDQHDWLDRWFTSDDMHLLRKCPCPVWLIKPQSPKAYRRILAAVDVDDAYSSEEMELRHALNGQILQMADSLALADCAELHVVHVWDAIGESALRDGLGTFSSTTEERVMDYVEQVRRHHTANVDALLQEHSLTQHRESQAYQKPKKHLVKGWARKEIPALAQQIDADLVVMGTVVRTGIAGFFMGNTAETILNQINCSVLAIKPPGFQTPVVLDE